MQATRDERIEQLSDIGYAIFCGGHAEYLESLPEEWRHNKIAFGEATISALIKAIAAMIVENSTLA